jgi:hypothetical protein
MPSLAYAGEGVVVCGVLWAGETGVRTVPGLVVLVFLLTSVSVHAECAWVLWEKISFTETGEQSKKTMKPNKEIPRWKWEVKSAFPPMSSSLTSFALCTGAMRRALSEARTLSMRMVGERQVSQPFDKEWGEASFLEFHKEGVMATEYKCLPDTVNPNR